MVWPEGAACPVVGYLWEASITTIKLESILHTLCGVRDGDKALPATEAEFVMAYVSVRLEGRIFDKAHSVSLADIK